MLDPPAGSHDDVTSLFQTALDSRGVRITPAKERLAAYLAVENTYLSTFQVLGGFGLLLGALGLAVVLLRNVWERRGELALLRALGYRHRSLGWLVFAENAALLLLGLGAGVGSALAAVAPHVLTGEGAVPWARLGLLLGLVWPWGWPPAGRRCGQRFERRWCRRSGRSDEDADGDCGGRGRNDGGDGWGGGTVEPERHRPCRASSRRSCRSWTPAGPTRWSSRWRRR